MSPSVSYRAASVVTGAAGAGGARGPGWVTVDGGHVAAVGPEPPEGTRCVDLGDVALWPGLVDLHADSLGRFESPRRGTRVPLPVAVHDTVADAVRHGITRPLLCVAVGEGPDPDACLGHARAVVEAVGTLAPVLPVVPAIHLRVDVGAESAPAHARALLEAHAPSIALVSVMDHTPGRRQYADVPTWRAAMRERTGADETELDRWLRRLPADRCEADSRRAAVGTLAAEFSTSLASHDDDTAEAATRAAGHGAAISEFPITREAAAAAHRAGLTVVMGAPNAWRGRSHLGALSARDALTDGHLDVLTSDYDHGALLHAAYALAADGRCSLARAAELITSAPARTLDPDPGDGTIAPGGRADLVAVRTAPFPVVTGVWSAGRVVMTAGEVSAG